MERSCSPRRRRWRNFGARRGKVGYVRTVGRLGYWWIKSKVRSRCTNLTRKDGRKRLLWSRKTRKRKSKRSMIRIRISYTRTTTIRLSTIQRHPGPSRDLWHTSTLLAQAIPIRMALIRFSRSTRKLTKVAASVSAFADTAAVSLYYTILRLTYCTVC